ncbi:hypothetical protein A3K79_06060 [Candidatus Bathyarchaeota archaeon RBG_13_46_16b]|nr:MAG: hypothetical protein A3K79_06060 [Candidatus Bathyarchaeota archaeon RBG_13_46_16b]
MFKDNSNHQANLISNSLFCLTNDYRLLIWVYEAPSSDALQKFSMEPEIVKWMAWNNMMNTIARARRGFIS